MKEKKKLSNPEVHIYVITEIMREFAPWLAAVMVWPASSDTLCNLQLLSLLYLTCPPSHSLVINPCQLSFLSAIQIDQWACDVTCWITLFVSLLFPDIKSWACSERTHPLPKRLSLLSAMRHLWTNFGSLWTQVTLGNILRPNTQYSGVSKFTKWCLLKKWHHNPWFYCS